MKLPWSIYARPAEPKNRLRGCLNTCMPSTFFTMRMHPDLPTAGYSALTSARLEPSLAGPKRPQDRVALTQVKKGFSEALTRSKAEGGFGVLESDSQKSVTFQLQGKLVELRHGSLTLAAITSCTNTSNPYTMIAAGLLAQKALALGLQPNPWVKASLSPGSRVVTEYLRKAGLLDALAQLGFTLTGYGCMTCIGNSGPLAPEIVSATQEHNLVTAAILSGNRNFEGRVNSHIQANYLASPPLVVAFALAGRIDIDLTREPLGWDKNQQPVYLKDLWPGNHEIERVIQQHIQPALFEQNNQSLFTGTREWQAIPGVQGDLYPWRKESTYLQEPPFFEIPASGADIHDARVLAYLGDSVTTDHISPAGSIQENSPAGQYLQENGVLPKEFNSYGSRRANDRVLTRATLANPRLKNVLAQGKEGGFTVYLPENKPMTIFEAAMRYQNVGIPLVILAGKEYGTGSSRDWAAKGVQQLGVRAVIAESFERIHRSNLAGMGVLPLQFLPGVSTATLQLTGWESFSISAVSQMKMPGEILQVQARRVSGEVLVFKVRVRLDTMNELQYYQSGGLLPAILHNFK